MIYLLMGGRFILFMLSTIVRQTLTKMCIISYKEQREGLPIILDVYYNWAKP